MELADNVNEKRRSFMKPESFDPQFGDKTYLVTDGAKSRLRGYLTTFGYMVLCGLFLLVGGGTFFIYESIAVNKQSQEGRNLESSVRAAPFAADSGLPQDRLQYSKEFQIVAFVFIGVGAVLFVVGAPLAVQFYTRYKFAKNSESSPILDPLHNDNARPRIYHKPETVELTTSKNWKKKKIPKTKRKATWMRKTTRSLSREGFRFAAHRHPSMNQISIDGSEFFSKRFDGNSSSESSDDDLSTIQGSPAHIGPDRSRSFIGFIHRIFSRTESQQPKLPDEKDGGHDNEIDDDISSQFKASNIEDNETPDTLHGSNIGSSDVTNTGGLYNLGD